MPTPHPFGRTLSALRATSLTSDCWTCLGRSFLLLRRVEDDLKLMTKRFGNFAKPRPPHRRGTQPFDFAER
jgi:hypothetical protein